MRAAGQLLHRPPGATPESIVRRLLAVQSQDMTQARRALRARGKGFTAADVDAVLIEDRAVVVAWFNRGTLHMVGRQDYPWLLGLTAPPQVSASRRRLGQFGIEPDHADRAVQLIERSLAEEGPVPRGQLRDRLTAQGIRAEGQAFAHLLFLAALRGIVVVGPLAGGQQGVALTRDWLGIEPPPKLEGERRDRALAELARRYLLAHGPATDRDLAYWAGLPLRDARAGLEAIAPDLAEVEGGLVDLAQPDRARAPRRVPLRLLPTWDAYLLGWKEREFLVAPGHTERIYREGMIGPAVTVDGLAVGRWSARRRGDRLTVEVDPGGGLHPGELEAEIADLARFEGVVPERR
jgi:hypothetical protein